MAASLTDAARALLDEAEAAGVRLEARLWASDPGGLPSELLARLRAHSPAVLRLLIIGDNAHLARTGGSDPSPRHNPTMPGVSTALSTRNAQQGCDGSEWARKPANAGL